MLPMEVSNLNRHSHSHHPKTLILNTNRFSAFNLNYGCYNFCGMVFLCLFLMTYYIFLAECKLNVFYTYLWTYPKKTTWPDLCSYYKLFYARQNRVKRLNWHNPKQRLNWHNPKQLKTTVVGVVVLSVKKTTTTTTPPCDYIKAVLGNLWS